MNAIEDRLELAVEIARRAGDETLKLFRQDTLQVELKGDGSPVTVADRAAEQLLRKLISAKFPGDAILGEEFGQQSGDTGFCWVLDPIDGTKSFIHGIPLYTTLVAVLQESAGQAAGGDQPNLGQPQLGQPQLGVIHSPATGETTYARVGGGCWYSANGDEPQQTSVSKTAELSGGLLVTTELSSYTQHRKNDDLDVFLSLQRQARLARTWGDAYGYLMVATGRAEAMIDPIVNLWDAAALKPIIEEAGGRFTDWQGEPSVHTGDAIATNGLVHESVLSQTRGR